MKKLSALLSLALGLCLIPAVFAADKKPTSASPAKPAAKVAAQENQKEEPLVGILIERHNGGFINLKVDGGNFVMTFLDKDKKEAKADVPRALARYRKNKADHKHLLVRSADEKSLRAPTPVDRPYRFNALLVVLSSDNEDTAAEAYTVNFKQVSPEDGAAVPVDEMTPEQLQKINK
jgi:hypothetical protein